MISFFVPGKIKGKERPRFSRGHAYTPKATRTQEAAIGLLAMVAMRGRQILSGPVQVEIEIIKEPPESWSDEKRESAHYCANGFDIDNAIKACLDGMNKIVFADDRQVAIVTARKVYSLSKPEGTSIRAYDLTLPPFTKASW